MFSNRTGAISRSFHAPHGVNIGAASKLPTNSKLKRKHSWSSSRVRNALSEGGLAPRPVLLKEGFLNKPSFFRFGGRKRRWCVVRTYSQAEAAMDVYMDESRSRYKGSISLDKESNPILFVKNTDGKRSKKASKCYFSVRVGKHVYSFTADSFREMKEWCSLLRQAMDNGNLFSGQVIEPRNLDDGMVNIKFNSNCIALLCPLKEVPLKTWRLDHITSFGQCGGILTFECCPTCSDPGAARCSINIVQEKPAHILNIMERAIRSNPNTSEIHYERSILGDIYHCSHDCCQPRLLPAYSEPNIFGSISPIKGMVSVVPVDHHSDFPQPSSGVESTDSGFPGTPQAEESLSISSNIPSPTGSSKSGHSFKQRASPSPKHSIYAPYKGRSMSDSKPSGQTGDYAAGLMFQRRQSDELPPQPSPTHLETDHRKMSDGQIQHHARLTYATISHDSTPRLVRKEELKSTYSNPPASSSVHYSAIHTDEARPQSRERRPAYNHLQPVDEYDSIYDVPNCEPESNPFSPPITPSHRPRRDSKLSSGGVSSQNDSPTHTTASATPVHNRTAVRSNAGRSPKTSVVSTMSSVSCYLPGSDVNDRSEDFEELPPIPQHRGRRARYSSPTKQVPVQPATQRNGFSNDPFLPQRRNRLKSSSEVLDTPTVRHSYNIQAARMRGSMDNLDQLGRNHNNGATASTYCNDRQLRGSTDLLERLQQEEEQLKLVLRDSTREREEELAEVPEPRLEFGRPFRFGIDDLEYDEPDPDVVMETSSNLLEYRAHVYSTPPNGERVLTKVASDTMRGYAYKIAIPLSNTQYDVPRRTAPTPDLANMRHDAPPKPMRYPSTEHLLS